MQINTKKSKCEKKSMMWEDDKESKKNAQKRVLIVEDLG